MGKRSREEKTGVKSNGLRPGEHLRSGNDVVHSQAQWKWVEQKSLLTQIKSLNALIKQLKSLFIGP